MATPSFALSLILLFLAMPYPSLSCPATPCECDLNLHLYLHQIVEGHPNHNQVVTHHSSDSAGFGTQVVVDWTVIDAVQPNATIIARAKGMVVQASVGVSARWFNCFSVVFQDARFSESTLEVQGNFYDDKDGQMAIVGGTGEFVSAHGVIKYKRVLTVPGVESYREFNISASYAPTTGYTCGGSAFL